MTSRSEQPRETPPPYNPSELCPKCWSGNVGTQYVPEVHLHPYRMEPCSEYRTEALERRCQNCRFVWYQAVVPSTRPLPLGSAAIMAIITDIVELPQSELELPDTIIIELKDLELILKRYLLGEE